MPRKRVKPEEKEVKDQNREYAEEDLAGLEEELEPEELESLEGEYTEDETLTDLNDEELDEMAAAEGTGDVEEESRERPEQGDGRMKASARSDMDDVEEEEMEPFEEYEEEPEEEEIPEAPMRRETRQEMLGRLMIQLLEGREQVHQALERVRDLNTQMRDAGPRPPEKLREAYHKATADLSRARREENFARAELMQVLSWRG